MQVGPHVYKKLALIGEHEADDVYFESISKETFEALDHPEQCYIDKMRIFPSNIGTKLGGVELDCSGGNTFSRASNVKRNCGHTMELNCFDGEI